MSKLIHLAWVFYEALQVPRNLVWQAWRGFHSDASWRFSGMPLVYRAGGNNPFSRLIFSKLNRTSEIKIGRNFRALSKPRFNSLGVIQKTLLRTCSYGARLEIADNVGLSGCTVCAAKSISIGCDTIVGTGAIITDSDLHPIDPAQRLKGGGGPSAPIVIGRNVFVGARAIILKGVTIGDNSVVGAGAVVAHDVPSNTVVAGNPARVVKQL